MIEVHFKAEESPKGGVAIEVTANGQETATKEEIDVGYPVFESLKKYLEFLIAQKGAGVMVVVDQKVPKPNDNRPKSRSGT